MHAGKVIDFKMIFTRHAAKEGLHPAINEEWMSLQQKLTEERRGRLAAERMLAQESRAFCREPQAWPQYTRAER